VTRPPRPVLVAGSLAVFLAILLAVLVPTTTFVGDDHLFLTFARLAPNPLVAFIRDQHGGEYYRPLPMLVWWVLGGLSKGSSFPFAALALALHATSALLLFSLLCRLGRARAVAGLAAALFVLAPQNVDAASWFSASTDLFATVFTLAALGALARGATVASIILALCAYVSKESALVLPLLAYVVLAARAEPPSRRARVLAVVPHAVCAALVLGARSLVLHGWGGSGDARAPVAAKLIQLASGLIHVATGPAVVLPEALGWGLGAAALALLVLSVARRRGQPGAAVPLVFTLVSLLPLLGPGWIVGSRYFYLPAVGLAWAAGEALAAQPSASRLGVCATLLVLSALQAAARGSDVGRYKARLAAARRAVADGARHGARVFHIDGGIKDLDLAVKEDPAVAAFADELLVLNDVPASFAIVPPALGARADFLLASPPLPPSGAYRFGDRRVVGLARRGDDPTLDDVISRFPDIRFIRLRPTPGGHVIARDVTDDIKGPGDSSD
jgi:hypothetical protein